MLLRTDHIRIDPAYRDALRACGLDNVNEILARVEGRVAAWSRTTNTLYVPGPENTPGFYLKRYFYPRWGNRLRGAFRGTFFGLHRGQAEFRALNLMRSLGVAAVRPVAVGGRRFGHFLAACFIITEEVPDARNLTTFAAEITAGRRTLSPAQRRIMVERLAERIAEMHAAGFAHGKLFWRNILVRGGPHGDPEFFFLDAQPPRRWPFARRRERWWQAELAHLLASARPFTTRAERLRFARRYFGAARLTAEMKSQIRWIERRAQRWRRHEARRIKMDNLFEEWGRQLALETGS